MVLCVKCGTCFRDNYCLTRHMSRKVPCNKLKNTEEFTCAKIVAPNTSLPAPNTSLEQNVAPNTSLPAPNTSLEQKIAPNTSSLAPKCEYCLNQYSRKSNLKKHQEICKYRDDPVRLLEIKNGITPGSVVSKTECRFCNQDFFNVSNLNRHLKVCEDREDYHQMLLLKQQKVHQVINNNNTTNNTTNNNTINNFNGPTIINILGNEDTSHIDISRIIDNLRSLQNNYENHQIYLKAGQMVISYDDIMRENPENRNIIVPSAKSLYTEVKTDSGWEKKEIDEALSDSFKNSAKKLYDTKESINAVDKRVLKENENKKIFDEVKQFAQSGLNYKNSTYRFPDDERKIRSRYKIGKLKDRITNDNE
jgi:hypothetical protein